MAGSRLAEAFPDGAPAGRVLVIGAGAGGSLVPLDPAQTWVQQENFTDHQWLASQGWQVAPQVPGDFDLALVCLPRAKAAARARIADAAQRLAPGAALWIDGQKTDGIDSILKELRALTRIGEVHSKGHGKIFCVTTGAQGWLPEEWQARPQQAAQGFMTMPGMFSADGVDPGSALLASHLPPRLPTRLVDLGAGWGWLSAQALAREGVEQLHLVEADHNALEAAQRNIADPRAHFHWADARDFRLPEPVNGVIMNPPFHSGRSADPRLGTDFIAAAARLLTGAGRLWMVANRHLPYEAGLARHFASCREIGGDNRFKIFEASGARRGAKTSPVSRI